MIFTPVMLRGVIMLLLYIYSVSVYSFTKNNHFILNNIESEKNLNFSSYHFYSTNLFALSASNDSPVCGDGTQSVTLSANGADPLNSIIWYDEDNNLVGNGNPLILPNVTAVFAGNYYAIEYDPGLVIVQTSNVTNVEVSEVFSDNAYAGEDQHLCYGTTLTNLSGAAPVVGNGFWTADAGNTSVATIVNPTLANTIISDLTTGTYTFRWTLSNGACTDYDNDEVTIIVGDVLVAPTYFGDEGVCQGEFLFMQGNTAPVGATYHWEGPNGFTSDNQNLYFPSATINNAGEYALTYITTDGCESLPFLQHIDIFYFQDFSAIIFDGTICMGDTLKLDSPTNGVIYEWIGPDGESAATLADPLLTTAVNFTRIPFGEDTYKAGFWKVRVTDMNGCSMDSDSVNVTINPIPNNPLIEAPSNICEGEDLQLQAPSLANTNYNWYQTVNGNPDSVLVSQLEDPLITELTSSSIDDPYVFCLKVNEGGCESTLTLDLASVEQSCAGLSNLTTYSIPFSGFNNITFSNVGGALWQMDYVHTGGNTIAQTMENVWIDSIAKGGTIQFNVIFAVGGGKVRFELIKDGNWKSFTRDGENYSIQFLYLSDPDITGYLKYFIVCPEYPLLGHNTPNFDGTEYITYVNRMIFQTVENIETNFLPDPLSCRAVTVSERPSLTPTHNGGVCGDSLRLFSNVEEIYSPYTFYWTGPNGFISFDENPVIANPESNNEGSYLVTVTDSFGCSNFGTVNVDLIIETVNQPIISSNLPLCEGDNLILSTLQVPGDSVSYFWFGPNGKSTANGDYPNTPVVVIENVTATESGNYSVNITANTCISINSIDLFVNINGNPQVNPTASLVGITCVSDTSSVDLLANVMGGISPYSYVWNGPSGFNSNVGNVLLGNLNEEKSGTYSVVAEDGNGCQSETGQVNLSFSDRPDMPIISSQGSTCFGEQLVLSVPYYSGSSVSYNWFLDGTALNINSNILVLNSVSTSNSGTYQIFMTVDGCNSDTSNLEVIINPEIEIIMSDINLDCQNGGNDLTLSALVSGGSGVYNYEWIGPNGFFSTNEMPAILNVTSLQSGSYVLEIIDFNGCESLVKSMTVNISDQLESPNLQPVGNVCEGEEVILSTQIYSGTGISYHWLFNGIAISNANANTFLIDPATPANSGLYQVFIEKNGCSTDTAEVMVNVNEKVSVTLLNQNITCVGVSTNVSLTANVSGGTLPYFYSWTGPNNFISNDENPVLPNANANFSGTYNITITDVNGCSSEVSTVVEITNQPAIPIINLISNGFLCEGETLELTTNSYSGNSVVYTWLTPSGNFTTTNPTLIIEQVTNANQDGIYSVSVDVEGCISPSSAQVNIDVVPTPSAPNVPVDFEICENDALVLTTSTVADNYEWTGPNGFYSTLQSPTVIDPASPLESGMYQLVISSFGCKSLASQVEVIVHEAPSIPTILSNSPVCSGEDIMLSTAISQAEYTYEWISPLGDDPIILSTLGLITNVPNITITNSSAAYLSGDWKVRIIDLQGCTSESLVASNVNIVNLPPNPTASNNSPKCYGEDVQLFAGGVAGANYFWFDGDPSASPAGVLISSVKDPIIYNLSEGVHDFWLKIEKDGCESENTTMTEVVVKSIPELNGIAASNTFCEGEQIEIQAPNFVNGTFHWTGPNGFQSFDQNLLITSASPLNTGVYSLQVELNGCSSALVSTSINVTSQPSTPTVSNNSPGCEGMDIQLFGSTSTTGQVVEYSWTGPNGFTSNVQNPILTAANNNQSGEYQLELIVDGCSSLISAPTMVEISSALPSPVVYNNTITNVVCEGEAVLLTTDFIAGANYFWTGPNGFNSSFQNPIINESDILDTGFYYLTININGCSSIISQPTQVNISSIPNAPVAINDGPGCEGNTISLMVPSTNTGTIYSWYQAATNLIVGVGDTLELNNISLSQAGNYYVIANNGGCDSEPSFATEIIINNSPNQSAFAGNDFDLCEETSTTLDAIPPVVGTGEWTSLGSAIIANPTSSNSPVFNLQEGSNIFVWTLSNGDCGAYSSDTLEIFGSIEANDLAEAGLDQNLCGVSDFNLLATPPNQATGLWTQPNIQQSLGVIIIDPTNPNTMVIGVNQGNTYVFYWSLSSGTCENYSEDEVLISIDEGTQDNAYAGEDIFHCGEASLVLNATTPLQGEGSWSTNSGAQIISPTNSSSLVVNLLAGENVFYWTLENGNCSNLSMDSMVVFSLENPIAVADVDTLLWNTKLEQMPIIINDDYVDSNIEITIISPPANGIVEVNNDGTINYIPNENFIGTEFFEYQICHVNCPDQCDIAKVEIVVKREEAESDIDCFVPSIITPNGDGTNDAFVIPCVVDYPNSKLQVFNRWGDEVYSGQPYKNDWEGTYIEFPLPDGSYFYLLNLDGDPKKMLNGYLIIRN